MTPKFKSTLNHGFQITFQNGLTISVQYGKGNYCSRKDLNGIDFNEDLRTPIIESQTAEIMVWDESGEAVWLDQHDEVLGYLSTDDVANMITLVSQAKQSGMVTPRMDLEAKLHKGKEWFGR